MAKKPTMPVAQRRTTKSSKSSKACEKKVADALATIDRLEPVTPQAANVIALLRSWLTDDTGYDEETWPKLKKALNRERARLGARSLFDG